MNRDSIRMSVPIAPILPGTYNKNYYACHYQKDVKVLHPQPCFHREHNIYHTEEKQDAAENFQADPRSWSDITSISHTSITPCSMVFCITLCSRAKLSRSIGRTINFKECPVITAQRPPWPRSGGGGLRRVNEN